MYLCVYVDFQKGYAAQAQKDIDKYKSTFFPSALSSSYPSNHPSSYPNNNASGMFQSQNNMFSSNQKPNMFSTNTAWPPGQGYASQGNQPNQQGNIFNPGGGINSPNFGNNQGNIFGNQNNNNIFGNNQNMFQSQNQMNPFPYQQQKILPYDPKVI